VSVYDVCLCAVYTFVLFLNHLCVYVYMCVCVYVLMVSFVCAFLDTEKLMR